MGKIKCPNYLYASDKWSVKRHFERKHRKQLATTNGTYQGQRNYASHPQPHLHPYITSGTQQGNNFPQRTPEMVANNTYYAKETRAPTVMSVGPNGRRAPTTVSVPPLTGAVQQGGSALGPTPSVHRGFGIGDQLNYSERCLEII
jgi:hypothetical protein